MTATCTETLAALPLFVYGDLAPTEMGRIGMHIGSCESCLTEHHHMIELLDLVDRLDAPPVRVDVEQVLELAMNEKAPADAPGPVSRSTSLVMLVVIACLLIGAFIAIAMLLVEHERPEELAPPAPVRAPELPYRPTVSRETESQPSRQTTLEEQGEDSRSGQQPGALVVGQGKAAARAVLGIAAAGDPLGDVRQVRRRLAATGVDVREFLTDSVHGGQIASARAALLLLGKIAPGQAVDAASRALRERSELRADCIETLVVSRDSRADAVLAAAWVSCGDEQVAQALSRRGGSRAAGAIAARVEELARAGAPVSEALWRALHAVGEDGAVAVTQILRSLDGDDLRRAIDVVSVSRSRQARAALAALLQDTECRLDAAVALARQGDTRGLRVLVATTRDRETWTESSAIDASTARARSALLDLATRSPRSVAAHLTGLKESDPDLLPLAAALIRVAPNETVRLIGVLASSRSRIDLALEVARSCDQLDAAAALLPLGSSRRLAGDAVNLLASFGDEAAHHLVRYLGSRYGTEPAREALTEIVGSDLGRDPSTWRRALRARPSSSTLVSVDPGAPDTTD